MTIEDIIVSLLQGTKQNKKCHLKRCGGHLPSQICFGLALGNSMVWWLWHFRGSISEPLRKTHWQIGGHDRGITITSNPHNTLLFVVPKVTQNNQAKIHPQSLTQPLKNDGWKTTFLLDGNFSGAMLNFQGVHGFSNTMCWDEDIISFPLEKVEMRTRSLWVKFLGQFLRWTS